MKRTVTYAGGLTAAAVALIMASGPARAADGGATARAPEPDPARVTAAVRMMTALRNESAAHATAIREAYAPAADTLALANRISLQDAIANGSILKLPPDLAAHNLRPRLTGRHPIGEADLAHQHLYVGARPETVGMLLAIASRVRSGPLEITSLARHEDYQRRLARTNANARTAVPTHIMGLAADISILHTSLGHAREIRDVLRAMARDGELLFIAERRQLVFHIVPAPARRAHFAALSRRHGDAERPGAPQLVRAPADHGMPAAIAAVTPSPSDSGPGTGGAVTRWTMVLLAVALPRALLSVSGRPRSRRPLNDATIAVCAAIVSVTLLLALDARAPGAVVAGSSAVREAWV